MKWMAIPTFSNIGVHIFGLNYEKEIIATILVSIGVNIFGLNFKFMRTKAVLSITVFKIIFKRQIRKVVTNFKHMNKNIKF